MMEGEADDRKYDITHAQHYATCQSHTRYVTSARPKSIDRRADAQPSDITPIDHKTRRKALLHVRSRKYRRHTLSRCFGGPCATYAGAHKHRSDDEDHHHVYTSPRTPKVPLIRSMVPIRLRQQQLGKHHLAFMEFWWNRRSLCR